MCAQTIGEQVRWQDLQVRSETNIVFDIAKREGWEDCEVFGSGDMITQPQESKGWKLIPADLYKYSIPMQAVARLHQVINAGIRVQGVIIADDTRREAPAPAPVPVEPEEHEPVPPPAPARPEEQAPELPPPARAEELRPSPPAAPAVPMMDPLADAEAVVSFAGKALLVLIRIAVMGSIVALGIYALFHYFWPVMILGFVIFLFSGAGTSTGTGSRVRYDPKLVILVDDGSGGTTWVSLFAWYD